VVLGDRPAALCRELTKRHEEIVRGRVSDVLATLDDDPKGEIVLVIGGAPEAPAPDLDACADEARALIEGGMRKREAAHAVAERHHVSANDVYEALIADE
jgi:16S rRNA (cytidine1402-2'-O)-methyltransferase